MNQSNSVRFRGRTLAASLALIGCVAIPAAGFAVQRTHTVNKIFKDGRPVAVAAATLTFRDGHIERSIRRGEAIPDGTRIEVPAREEVVLTSTGGKSTTTLEPNASFTPMQTGAGETSSLDRGSALFSVVRGALDFFQVNHTQRFNASVKGTEFRVDTTGPSVKFVCTKGSVAVTQVGTMRVGSKNFADIRKVEYLSADGRREITYPYFFQYLATFANFTDAKNLFQQKLTYAEANGDAAGILAGLTNVGRVERYLGEYANARTAYRRVFSLYQAAGNRDGEADALNELGNVERDSGNFNESLQLHQQSLALFRQLNDRGGEARALTDLGLALLSLERYDDAEAVDRQALELNRQLGDGFNAAANVNNLGNVQFLRGRFNDALASYQTAIVMYRRFGDRDAEARALNDIGAVSERLERYADALASFQAAYAVFHQLGDREGEGATLNNIGIALSSLGRYNEALASFYASLTVRHQLGDWRNEAGVYGGISDTEILLHRPRNALEDAKRGATLDPRNLRLQMKLANAYLFLGDVASAQSIYLRDRAKPYDNTTVAASVLKDFERYRKAGIDSPEMARMEELLRRP